MKDLPTGTVTFLFTDIEGSTALWEKHPEAMKSALAKHDSILRNSIEANLGVVIKTTGDGVHAVFESSMDAVNAAVVVQKEFHEDEVQWILADQSAPLHTYPLLRIKVRMGLHTGEAELRDGDYYGSALNRAVRLMSAAHGGQILLSKTTAELVREQLPTHTTLRDLGEHRLKDLVRSEHIFQLTHPDLAHEFPPIQSLDAFPNNLPVQLTSFIGREKEIADIKTLLDSSRLVTLTGSGGTGKTRLSVELGVQELANFPNGVWLIELAPLTTPAQIIPLLAQVFGLQEMPSNSLENMVHDYLRDKKLLLIFDNCEHLIEACARLAEDLLHQCISLKILASSREGLGILGEMAYRIPSLADSESIQLFVDRARAANANFMLTDVNSSAVAKICSRLDGIPLALELAAARVKLLSPEQIAARLDDRFRLLIGGSRNALPRQQTLRALIDWSYDLLAEEERHLLQFASVFVGGWTLDALEAVADSPNTLELLEQLVNKSLVVAEEFESEMRYFTLETIRQYAREKLFEAQQSSQARDRHFLFFDELSEKIWAAFRSPDALLWRERSESDLENLRAALDWGMEHYPEAALRLAANYCLISGSLVNASEALGSLKSALDRVRSLPPVEGEANRTRQKLIAAALFSQGMVGMGGAGFPEVIRSFQEAISISRMTGDKRILGYSLEMYFIASRFNHAPDGPAAAEEGLAILSEIKDWWGIYMATMNMVGVSSLRGDLEQKEKYLAAIQERLHAAPLAIQSGLFYLTMGYDERARGNYELAKQHFETGLIIFRRLRNKNFQYVMQSELGHIEREKGEFSQAKEIYKNTIRGWQELGARPAIAHQLECFAFMAIAEEQPYRAAQLLGAAEALRDKVQSPMTDNERVEYGKFIAELRSMLPETDFHTLWAEGRSMTMDQAVQLALG